MKQHQKPKSMTKETTRSLLRRSVRSVTIRNLNNNLDSHRRVVVVRKKAAESIIAENDLLRIRLNSVKNENKVLRKILVKFGINEDDVDHLFAQQSTSALPFKRCH